MTALLTYVWNGYVMRVYNYLYTYGVWICMPAMDSVGGGYDAMYMFVCACHI